MMIALLMGNIPLVQLLLSHVVETMVLNQADKQGQTLFIKAVKRGDEVVARDLLRREGLDINRKDKDGRSAFMHACDEGHEGLVKLLFEYPVIADDTANYNRNALM